MRRGLTSVPTTAVDRSVTHLVAALTTWDSGRSASAQMGCAFATLGSRLSIRHQSPLKRVTKFVDYDQATQYTDIIVLSFVYFIQTTWFHHWVTNEITTAEAQWDWFGSRRLPPDTPAYGFNHDRCDRLGRKTDFCITKTTIVVVMLIRSFSVDSREYGGIDVQCYIGITLIICCSKSLASVPISLGDFNEFHLNRNWIQV